MADIAARKALSVRLSAPSGLSVGRMVAWGAAVGFAVMVAGLLAHGSGHVVQLIFPALALLVGAILYGCHPTLYLGFTWWLWFLTPEIRRIVDYQIGYFSPISLVMIAPYLVAGLAGFTLLRRLPQLLQRGALFPFALVLLGINYAYMIGFARAGPLAATYGLLTWIVPVLFGFHVASHWQRYPLYRDAIQRVFLWGVLVMGVYGIVQFVALPPWDAFWMKAVPINSIGRAHPFEVRVYSTMNSQQPFALTMMAGLLFAFAVRGPWPLIAAAPGYVTFLLSLVRTAWLAWIIGALFLLAQTRGVQRMRLLAVAILLCLLSVPALLFEPLSDRITDRFETMQGIGEDNSFNARLAIYANFAVEAIGNVTGAGFGGTNLATKLTNEHGENKTPFVDSGVLESILTLGWIGGILYGSGLGWLLALALGGMARRMDLPAQGACAIVLAALAAMLSFNTLIGAGGMVFWSFLGLTLSARIFHGATFADLVRDPERLNHRRRSGSAEGAMSDGHA